jgi:hypothetical protein
MLPRNVFPKQMRTKRDVSDALATAWFRVSKRIGKGALADATGAASTKTVDNAIAGRNLPELHTVLNALTADASAMDEVLALYGMRAVPLQAQAANDMHTIAALSGAASEWLNRLLDGNRCHRDTAHLAEIFRPLVCEMQAIIAEAEKARAA